MLPRCAMTLGVLRIVLLAVGVSGSPHKATAAYTITDLGYLGSPSPGGSYSDALAINDKGQVVGEASTGSGGRHAFIYDKGKITDLFVLPGGSSSHACCINASGQVAGCVSYFANGTEGDTIRAVLWDGNGQMTDLGTFDGSDTVPTDINAKGQVTGYSNTADGKPHAFLYSNGKLVDLGILPGGSFSVARRINDRGQVVGFADTATTTRAFLYNDGKMTDLGTLGGSDSYASWMNAVGQVTGFSRTADGKNHAFLYSNGKMADLGTFGGASSRGVRINDCGQVAGYAETAEGDEHTFLYNNGKMTDLGTLPGCSDSRPIALNVSGQIIGNAFPSSRATDIFNYLLYSNGNITDVNDLVRPALGWTIVKVAAINDAGQIVGQGKSPNRELHAILLTPVP